MLQKIFLSIIILLQKKWSMFPRRPPQKYRIVTIKEAAGYGFFCALFEEHLVNDQCQLRSANGEHKLLVERHKSSPPLERGSRPSDQLRVFYHMFIKTARKFLYRHSQKAVGLELNNSQFDGFFSIKISINQSQMKISLKFTKQSSR